MSNFLGATEKLHIKSFEHDVDAECIAQYNPKDLTIDKKVPWQKHSYTNKTEAKGGRGHIAYEFTGAEGRTVSVMLQFDTFGSSPAPTKNVVEQVAALEKLAAVKDPSSPDENKRRPPLCIVVWGSSLPSFTCVITGLQTKYTVFNKDGFPLRAECTITLQEADTLSTKDAESSAPDAQAGAASNGGSGSTQAGTGGSGGAAGTA